MQRSLFLMKVQVILVQLILTKNVKISHFLVWILQPHKRITFFYWNILAPIPRFPEKCFDMKNWVVFQHFSLRCQSSWGNENVVKRWQTIRFFCCTLLWPINVKTWQNGRCQNRITKQRCINKCSGKRDVLVCLPSHGPFEPIVHEENNWCRTW